MANRGTQSSSEVQSNVSCNIPLSPARVAGFSANRTSRLPSIRSPRDLTLGASTRKVFVPNIPVRREKKTQLVAKNRSTEAGKKRDPRRKNNHTRQEYVQLPGVMFGDGVMIPTTAKKGVHAEVGYSLKIPQKGQRTPKKDDAVKTDFNHKIEMKDDGDLSDSFIEDEDNIVDDKRFCPTVIPMNVSFKKFTEDTSLESKISKCSSEKSSNLKTEDEKVSEQEALPQTSVQIESKVPTLEELFDNVNLSEDSLILLKLPDLLSLSPNQDTASNGSLNNQSDSLHNYPSGHIGKLQLLSNGQCRLVVNDMSVELIDHIAMPYDQRVCTIQKDGDIMQITELGPISSMFTGLPIIEDSLPM